MSKTRRFIINVEDTKRKSPPAARSDILAQEDTDGDHQITIHDRGPKTFTVGTADSEGFKKFEIRGTYALSNLLQELALASDYGRETIILDEDRLNENPVDRMSRLIKFHFWDGLTRRIDAEGLEKICADPKNRSNDQRNRIYVPFHDALGFEYYSNVARSRPHLNLDVVRLPEIITPQFVKSINTSPGILSLSLRKQRTDSSQPELIGAPFVVPGGRFNEMYGWDSYFEALGLLVDGRVELARGMVENFWYEIEHYGKILNANRSYYLTRSQPPFLTDMTIQVHRKLADKIDWTNAQRHSWIACGVRAAIKEHLSVWKAAPRLDSKCGLSKYYPEGIGMPPETESTHFNHILMPYANKAGLSLDEYSEKYVSGEINEPELDQYFVHDRAVRESGHDTTYRFEKRCAHLATVDLNSLVYRYEADIAGLITEHFGGSFTVRVRRGPEDLYFKRFLAWRSNLAERGVQGSIGNDGGWDSWWAKGICVFDGESAHPADFGTHVVAPSEPGASLADLSAPSTPAASSPTTGRGLEDALHGLEAAASTVPEFDAPQDSSFFTVHLSARLFAELAEHTRELMTKYLWSETDRMFFDWDCSQEEQSVYESVTCLWPLWAGSATAEQARAMVPVALAKFEVVGGLVSGTEASRGAISLDRPNRQWDFPFGWAPHQIMAWAGLERYGFQAEARRVCYRWLYTLTKSFVDFNGVVPEKFDVVNMTHKVHVEYGNVGADFRFVVREGFGWMNASYELGL
ncbi:alpha,alpha-trehalase nth1 [Polyrhizophydium stewartii]|uniref:Trehalase n=1 Tax=Polyrhizophydium stewartii TaxID=2732419 RepID=A0ABR4N7Z3_9FUNG